jgi:hypothetical protein
MSDEKMPEETWTLSLTHTDKNGDMNHMVWFMDEHNFHRQVAACKIVMGTPVECLIPGEALADGRKAIGGRAVLLGEEGDA